MSGFTEGPNIAAGEPGELRVNDAARYVEASAP